MYSTAKLQVTLVIATIAFLFCTDQLTGQSRQAEEVRGTVMGRTVQHKSESQPLIQQRS